MTYHHLCNHSNTNTKSTTSGAWITYRSDHLGLYRSIVSFRSSSLSVIVCPFYFDHLWSILWITVSDYNFRFVKLLVNKKEYKQTITWLFNFHRFGPMIQCMFPLRFPHRKRCLNVCMRMHVLLCCLLFVFPPYIDIQHFVLSLRYEIRVVTSVTISA